MKLILLSNTGKCGTLFIQRLFDGHPLVITFPFAFNFYYAWSKLLTPKDDLSSFVNKLLDFTSLKEVLNTVNREKYIKSVRDHLPNDFKVEKDRKELLEALHLAFNHLTSLNRKATHILLNTINVNSLDLIQKDYPEHKHIFLIRDPKNSFAAYLSSDKTHNPVYQFQFLRNTLHNAFYTQIFFHKHPHQVNFLKIEELNEELAVAMKKLCKWLNINFSDILLRETINSRTYQSPTDKVMERKKSAKIRNTRWVHTLTPTEVVLIEFLHKELIKDHYQFATTNFFRNPLVAIFYAFMPNFTYQGHDATDQHSLADYFNFKQWFITRWNWFRLIRAVASKDRMQL